MDIDEALDVINKSMKHYKRIQRATDLPIGSPQDLTELFGANVRRERQELWLSMEELGVRAHTSGSYIQQIETGKVSPTITSVEKIAAALNVDPWVLFVND